VDSERGPRFSRLREMTSSCTPGSPRPSSTSSTRLPSSSERLGVSNSIEIWLWSCSCCDQSRLLVRIRPLHVCSSLIWLWNEPFNGLLRMNRSSFPSARSGKRNRRLTNLAVKKSSGFNFSAPLLSWSQLECEARAVPLIEMRSTVAFRAQRPLIRSNDSPFGVKSVLVCSDIWHFSVSEFQVAPV
jgi:hypothetical protein